MADRVLRLGTRGSRLAMAQAEKFRAQLMAGSPGLSVEIIAIKTSGDLGKRERLGAFVREIQESLFRNEVDIALHCLKDLPTESVLGLRLSAYLEREDVRDTLVSRGPALKDLPAGSIIGTGSVRRTSQLNATCPGHQYRPLVGNVDTRLRKLMEGEYDAIVLAHAGLKRLGLFHDWASTDYATLKVHHFAIEALVPAPGQAVIVAETREGDAEAHSVVSMHEHRPSRLCADAERDFLRAFGGGCSVPVAAYATLKGESLSLTGLVAAPDGSVVLRDTESGHSSDGSGVAARLTERLGAQGAFELFSARIPERAEVSE